MSARERAEQPGPQAARGPAPRRNPLPEKLSLQEALALQRTLGNRAVSRLMDENEPASAQRSSVEEVLSRPGTPLAAPVRAEMEARLGADFSGVRLHTGPAARESAAGIGARAYTSGDHVVIGDGGTDSHTLAHELTHVIQQRQGPVAGADNGSGLRISDPGDRFERAADANAARVLSAPLPRKPIEAAETETAQRENADEPGRQAAEAVQRVEEGTIGAHFDKVITAGNQQIEKLVAKVGETDKWHLVNALLDPALDLESAFQIGGRPFVSHYLRDRLDYSSCFPTAEALFPLLTGGSVAQTAQGRNPDRCDSAEEFRDEANVLADALERAHQRGAPAVFRIEFAGHGFTLVLRRGSNEPGGEFRFELIESLAHTAGIVDSLLGEDSAPYPLATVTKAIRDMASARVGTRRAGAKKFGWNADAIYLGGPVKTEQERFPHTRLKWWESPLQEDMAMGRWLTEFNKRFSFLAHVYEM